MALKGARRTRCRSGRCGPPGTLPWSVTPTRSWMPSPSLGEDEDSVGRQRHVVGAVVVVGVNVGVGVVAGSQSRRRPERMTENIRPVREGHGRFAVVPPNTRPPHHGRWDAGQAFGRWAGYCIGGWADAAYCFGLGLVAAQFAHTGERGSLVVELRGFEPRTFSSRKCADAISPLGSYVDRGALSARGDRGFGRGGHRGHASHRELRIGTSRNPLRSTGWSSQPGSPQGSASHRVAGSMPGPHSWSSGTGLSGAAARGTRRSRVKAPVRHKPDPRGGRQGLPDPTT